MHENDRISHDFLVSLSALLTLWRHSSSRAKSAWFKSCSGVKLAFPKYEKYLCDRSKIFRFIFFQVDLQNNKNWPALQVLYNCGISNTYISNCMNILKLFNSGCNAAFDWIEKFSLICIIWFARLLRGLHV